MKAKIYFYYLLGSLFLICSCKEDAKFKDHNWLIVESVLDDVTSEGFTVSATLTGGKKELIVEKGFIVTRHFRTYGSPSHTQKHIVIDDHFTLSVYSDLVNGMECMVQAYIKTIDDEIFMGNQLLFNVLGCRPPELESVSAIYSADWENRRLIFKGNYFSPDKRRMAVEINGYYWGNDILECSENEIVIRLNTDQIKVASNILKLTIGDNSYTFNWNYEISPWRITSVNPSRITIGDIIHMEYTYEGSPEEYYFYGLHLGERDEEYRPVDLQIISRDENKLLASCHPSYYPPNWTFTNPTLYFKYLYREINLESSWPIELYWPWKEVSAYPSHDIFHTAVTVGQKGYYLSREYLYCIDLENFEKSTYQLPEKQAHYWGYSPNIFVYNNRLYIECIVADSEEWPITLETAIYRFDPADKTWEKTAINLSIPTDREKYITQAGETLYIYHESGTPFLTSYDLQSGKTTEMIPSTRLVNLQAYGEYFYFFDESKIKRTRINDPHQEEIVFDFSHLYPNSFVPLRKGCMINDKLYLLTQYFIIEYDLKTNTYKSLGNVNASLPYVYEMLLFPTADTLFGGVAGKLYKYTPE